MILSVSRRTDIPNYYPEWFINRVKEGYLYVRNPMNVHQISRVPITPDIVDCIVFWTKNPKNMLPYLDELKEYQYYFQYTITGYGKGVERGVLDKKGQVIPTFTTLSEKIGREKVIWRYDPILVTDKYTLNYHRKAFSSIAERLRGYTEKVVISFVDFYDKTKRNTKELNMIQMTDEDMRFIAAEMADIACKNGCRYCYANYNDARVEESSRLYDPDSPLLCGSISSDDKITERKVKSLKRTQLDFFDYL